MKKNVILFVALLLALPCQALAHHPAADIVDAEIYAMIDAMVADTPHADLTFDDVMGDGDDVTIIETDTVSTAEALIDEGLLADLSLLDGEVTVTLEFPDDVEMNASAALQFTGSREAAKGKYLKWSEWGGPVKITIHQVTTVP